MHKHILPFTNFFFFSVVCPPFLQLHFHWFFCFNWGGPGCKQINQRRTEGGPEQILFSLSFSLLFCSAGVGGTKLIPSRPGSERCGRGGGWGWALLCPRVSNYFVSISLSKPNLIPAIRKATSARAKQTAKLVKFSLVIVAAGGERCRGARWVPARGAVGALPPLPLLPQPEPGTAFICDPLKHDRSLQCTFMTRAFPSVPAVELKSGDIKV